MAALGPLFPCSALPSNGTYAYGPINYQAAGANSKAEELMMVVDATTLAAAVAWQLRFELPSEFPSGVDTCKLVIRAMANVSSGVAKIEPSWVLVATEVSPSAATYVSEGVSTITWAASDEDVYKTLEVTLDAADVIADGAGKVLAMNLTINDTDTTIAAHWGFRAFLMFSQA